MAIGFVCHITASLNLGNTDTECRQKTHEADDLNTLMVYSNYNDFIPKFGMAYIPNDIHLP